MSATTLGTTGNWGIPVDQSGILLTDVSFDFSSQEKTVLDRSGEVIGIAFYQSKIDIKLSGLVPASAPFSARIGTALVVANAIPAHLPQAGGTTVVNQISRSLNNEDFEKIEITATHYPHIPPIAEE